MVRDGGATDDLLRLRRTVDGILDAASTWRTLARVWTRTGVAHVRRDPPGLGELTWGLEPRRSPQRGQR